MQVATFELLEKANFTPAQVKALAQVIEDERASSQKFLEDRQEQHATKKDIVVLELKIEQARSSTIQWMIGLLMAQTGILLALLRLFPSHM